MKELRIILLRDRLHVKTMVYSMRTGSAEVVEAMEGVNAPLAVKTASVALMTIASVTLMSDGL